ncbi:MAG: primosomal protein N' [Clostridiales bacterium]|jgi:primosomal protein N' (replication factor Y)|nr:primosomal protein N' [Clostridiales bacterium]
MIYVSVCVDSASPEVDRLFTYYVPDEIAEAVVPGMRVQVPFGLGNKMYKAYVTGFAEQPDIPPGKIKPVARVLGSYPVFTEETLALAFWMKEKYYATLALCMRCVLPSGLTGDGVPPKPRQKKAAGKKESALNGGRAGWPEPTDEQQAAINAILPKLRGRVSENSPVFLLHGVTGSGKTEVYLHIIAETLKLGKQAIVLVPEIALTPQTVALFTERFGEAVAVTHSRLSGGERFRLWKRALDGEVSVMIGPRSAVFTPFKQLGAIIIDEEHEHTYQSENTPKYDAREVARRRAAVCGAVTVMGSATPSLESYYRAAEERRYTLLKLTERVNRMFPSVEVTDMRRELAEGNVSLFGRPCMAALAETFAEGRHALLFLNRRGHSSFVSCRWCGHVLKCVNCDVNYTWHSAGEKLLCHYCGREVALPSECPACGSEYLKNFGLGTQKVEEEMSLHFPGIKCLRMDFDSTKGKDGHGKILESFRRGEAQVLIGTQMIAKGLDFPNVVLVCVLAADMSLFSGDFRAGEYTFQLLTQVSGRAGRAGYSGRVFLQTYNPEHYAIELARKSNYEAFYKREIALRKSMRYPPFTHIFEVLFTGPDERAVITALHKLRAVMGYCNKKGFFETLGPAPAFVSKIKSQYRWKILVKGADGELLKKFVLYCIRKLKDNDPLAGVSANLTLDPTGLE